MFSVGQIVAWDCPKREHKYVGIIRKRFTRKVSVEILTGTEWIEEVEFTAKGRAEGPYGGQWVLRQPSNKERREALCILLRDEIEDVLVTVESDLRDVPEDKKPLTAILSRASALLKTVQRYQKP